MSATAGVSPEVPWPPPVLVASDVSVFYKANVQADV